MATGSPRIIEEIEILDTGQSTGGAGSTFYELPDQDNIELTLEEDTSTVEDGQTIINALDGSFQVLLYDDTILSDSHVQTGSSIGSEAKVIFHGATGTDDIAFDNVRPRVLPDRTTSTRTGYSLRGSKRSTSDPFS